MEREKLGSRLGFILLSAGCAIGVGNVWKFPYMAGQYGGGIFVLIYLIFLVIFGVPIMTMEFSLGRASQKSPAMLYQKLEKPGQKWHIHGYAAFGGNIVLMMFYTTVTAWLLQYFVKTLGGTFSGLTPEQVGAQFPLMLQDHWTQLLFVAIVVVIGVVVCIFGVKNSLEKVSKIMMVALLIIMVGLAIYSLTLDGAKEGLMFYLVPDFSKVNTFPKLANVIAGALSQAFFTLSLGIGSMAIFGSYLSKDRSLLGESIMITGLDTFVALVSGLIIFPACFTYNGGVVDEGGGFIFMVFPNIFNSIQPQGLGVFIGALFFVFLSFAALSTIFAVFENIFACAQDIFGWSRKKSCLIMGAIILVLSIPCVLGLSVWSGVRIPGIGDIMDMEDFLVSYVLLPLGSLCYVLFCVTKKGWGYENFEKEANTGKGLKVQKWMKPYLTYVLPVLVIIAAVIGLLIKFKLIG
ncbi:MAG: sodium-dependent transporter [Clostridia bacterium]|nr:sodium-dependent transporter [Clostridia bacterium]